MRSSACPVGGLVELLVAAPSPFSPLPSFYLVLQAAPSSTPLLTSMSYQNDVSKNIASTTDLRLKLQLFNVTLQLINVA